MNQEKLNKYIQRAYETAVRHGFHDKSLPMQHWLMLVITEVAEMVEADRKGKHAQVEMFKRESITPQPKENREKHWCFCFETFIKDSFEDEMADICIRLFDLAGLMGWKIEPLDMTLFMNRYQELYNGMTITEKAYRLCQLFTYLHQDETVVQLAIPFLECMAKESSIDLEWHIAQKMEYNAQRGRLHGKKY